MKIYKLLPVIIIAGTLVSCKKETPGSNNDASAKTFLNVNYGADPLQKMDVYLPALRSSASTKILIMIHGGAWSSGDKTELTPFVDTFKRRLPGYALFNINYRLSAPPNNLFPTQENDVKAAVEFIFNKANEYSISDKYALIGASAGGHLALLHGYKYLSPKKPKAIVSLSGPTNLADMYNNPVGGNAVLSTLLASVLGKTPGQDSILYASSSPVNYITNSTAPTLLLYGDADPIVGYTQAEQLKIKLEAAGIVNQFVLYTGSAHVDTWSRLTFFDSFTKIEAFLTANVL